MTREQCDDSPEGGRLSCGPVEGVKRRHRGDATAWRVEVPPSKQTFEHLRRPEVFLSISARPQKRRTDVPCSSSLRQPEVDDLHGRKPTGDSFASSKFSGLRSLCITP